MQGVTVTNLRPDQLEHEVLLFWAAVMPVVGNPIIYLFCVTEYRQNILAVWRSCTQGNNTIIFIFTCAPLQERRRMSTMMTSFWTFPGRRSSTQ